MNEVDNFITKFSGLTEEYKFYDGEITLRYDPKDHVYLLVTPEGTLEPQEGVTSICHILDKSMVLLPWACKMMASKLLSSIPVIVNGEHKDVPNMRFEQFERLVLDSKSAHKEKLADAGYVGNIAHAWIEAYIKAVLSNDNILVEQVLANPPQEPRASNACEAALKWMKRHNVRWLLTERKVYSRENKYAGTMDGLCRADSCDDSECCKEKFKNRLTLPDWKTSNALYLEYILQISAYKQAYEEETKQKIEDAWVIRLGKEDGEFEAWHVPLVLYTDYGWEAFKLALALKKMMDKVEEEVDKMKDSRKAVRKAERKAKKLIDSAKQCKGSVRYKGIRKPTCGCDACLKKYEEHQASKIQKLNSLKETKTVSKPGALISHELIKSLQFLLDMKPEQWYTVTVSLRFSDYWVDKNHAAETA